MEGVDKVKEGWQLACTPTLKKLGQKYLHPLNEREKVDNSSLLVLSIICITKLTKQPILKTASAFVLEQMNKCTRRPDTSSSCLSNRSWLVDRSFPYPVFISLFLSSIAAVRYIGATKIISRYRHSHLEPTFYNTNV